jgi:prepilin-type N-terminal cleavage/methylation domain-containing protein
MKLDLHSYRSNRSQAFTLVEMMVSMAVLALMIALISQVLDSATTLSIQGNKHMDGDAQARAVFDRMAIDFAQIVRRSDVDYLLKDPTTTFTGNDRMAFYSQVAGYNAASTTSSEASPISLVSYRVNSDGTSPYYNQLERLGYGLAWNGYSAAVTDVPVVFSSASTTVIPNSISSNWPNVNGSAADMTHEELIGPQVFRMEYYYVLRGQTIASGTFTGSSLTSSTLPAQLSATPWYTGTAAPFTDHTSVSGLQDVAAITVVIALIDPKSRAIVSNTQLTTLAGQMNDFVGTMKPGDLEAQWATAISASAIPKTAASSIRVYRRDFYLPSH